MTRVLVVEDEESFSDALSYMLRKEGFDPVVATTGPEALAEFDRGGADIVLLDLMLPGLPGTEVCRQLRSRSDVEAPADAALEAGPVRMDVERHVVSVDGAPVALPLKEFDLLELLMRNAGRVLTRVQLIDRVWGSDYVGDTKTLDVHVKRLRAKIEPDPANPKYLVTVRGLGYKLEA
jgi:two-component system response regulator RegX3